MRTITILTALLLAAPALAQTPVVPTGSGTEADPYRIASLANLHWITLNPGQWDRHYLQTADIDAAETAHWAGGAGWLPIGNAFTGVYDGAGHTITQLHINRPGVNDIGLFSRIGTAGRVENLTLLDAAVTGGSYVVGILAGLSSGTIRNAAASGTVAGGYRVGGLVGENNPGLVEDSHADVAVNAADGRIGGLVGFNVQGTVRRCHAVGAVSGGWYVGGLVGRNLGGFVQDSYATGAVSGSSVVGGLVGDTEGGAITSGYATGSAAGGSSVGGLVGYSWQTTITNTFAIGGVTGSGWGVGGLVGYRVGGQVTQSYWNLETSGQVISDGGEGRSTAAMTHPYAGDTYVGWDFAEIWAADPDHLVNDGYPYLQWQPQPPDDPVAAPPLAPATALRGNHPNPFNPATTIRYTVAAAQHVEIAVHTMAGQRVRTLIAAAHQPGEHRLTWDGRDEGGRHLASGVYWCVLQGATGRSAIRLVLLK